MTSPPASWAALQARRGGPTTPAPPAGGFDLRAIRRERARVLQRQESLRPPITRAIAVPRAIPLGPSRRVVSELRLRHLAELQAYLEEVEPHPLDGMPPAWADPDPGTRMARLAVAWERAAAWPPRLGTARGGEILHSPGGRAHFLATCLREHDPGFGLADALDLLPRITPAQWSGLRRVAYAIHPRLEIAAELAPRPVARPAGRLVRAAPPGRRRARRPGAAPPGRAHDRPVAAALLRRQGGRVSPRTSTRRSPASSGP